jgi:hypothetical protein
MMLTRSGRRESTVRALSPSVYCFTRRSPGRHEKGGRGHGTHNRDARADCDRAIGTCRRCADRAARGNRIGIPLPNTARPVFCVGIVYMLSGQPPIGRGGRQRERQRVRASETRLRDSDPTPTVPAQATYPLASTLERYETTHLHCPPPHCGPHRRTRQAHAPRGGERGAAPRRETGRRDGTGRPRSRRAGGGS